MGSKEHSEGASNSHPFIHGDSIEGDEGSREDRILLRYRILSYLERVSSDRGPGYRYSTHLEVMLGEVGLLSQIEGAGILPGATVPNPFDFESDPAHHEQWWREHPDEAENFVRSVEKRAEILKYLYMGLILARILPNPPTEDQGID